MHKSIKVALAGAAITTLALTGCSSGGSPSASAAAGGEELVIDGEVIASAEVYAAAQEEDAIVFYTGGSEVSEQQAADAFTEATGLEVEIVRLAPNGLNSRILAEQSAGQLAADVIRISGEDLIAGIAESGAFAPVELTEDIAGGLIPEATYEDGLYFSSFDRVYSFGYNNQVVDEANAPQDWADLLDPQWAGGQAGIVQVGAGGSTAALTRFQLDVLGEQWMRDFAANDPRIFESSAALTDAVARGEIAVGPMPIATAYSASLDGAPITIATPAEGAAAYPFYLGATAGAGSPNAAAVFVNWLLSTQGQTLAAQLGDYPVREGAPNPTIGDIELPEAGSEFVFRSTLEESLDNLEADAALWTEIFGYTG
jgi:iron(III) transport system substrate-binding protein